MSYQIQSFEVALIFRFISHFSWKAASSTYSSPRFLFGRIRGPIKFFVGALVIHGRGVIRKWKMRGGVCTCLASLYEHAKSVKPVDSRSHNLVIFFYLFVRRSLKYVPGNRVPS